MVVIGDFSCHILLGDAKAEEFPPTARMLANVSAGYNNPNLADSFVETDYFHATSYPRETKEEDPYGEEIIQNYNVTPYAIKVQNNSPNEVGCQVLVDGHMVFESCLGAGKESHVRGVQERPGHHDSAMRELLWSRPKSVMQKGERVADVALTPEQLFNLGAVRVQFYVVKRWSEEVLEAPAGSNQSTSSNRGDNQIEKVAKSVAKAKKVTGCSETGNVIADTVKVKTQSGQGSSGGMITKHYYKALKDQAPVGEIVVRYRSMHELQMLGVIKRAPDEEQGGDDKKKVKKEGEVVLID